VVSLSSFQKARNSLFLLAFLGFCDLGHSNETPAVLVDQALQSPKQLCHLDVDKAPGLPSFVRDFLFWLKIQHACDDLSFSQVKTFIETHPAWPRPQRLQMVAEDRLTPSETPGPVVTFFKKHHPITAKGALAYLKALLQTNQTRSLRNVAQETWIKMPFSPSEQRSFLTDFGKQLKRLIKESKL